LALGRAANGGGAVLAADKGTGAPVTVISGFLLGTVGEATVAGAAERCSFLANWSERIKINIKIN
jgi:hypothetical protein